MSLTTGTKLGRYEIRSKIGAGGMGEVYLAEDTKLDRKVALKVLPPDVAAHQDRMLLHEAGEEPRPSTSCFARGNYLSNANRIQ